MNRLDECLKIWAENESEPEGDLLHNTEAPKNWFRESPKYAVELYALEKGYSYNKPMVINIRTVAGDLLKFKAEVHMEPTVNVEKIDADGQ